MVQGITHLARSLVAAARNWTLYPPEHPAAKASFERLSQAIQQATNNEILSMAITPDTLLVGGQPVTQSQAINEAARLLHDRDLLVLTFSGAVPVEAVASLLRLLSMDSPALRAGGGPAAVWSAHGHHAITLEQIDYVHVLEDKNPEHVRQHDDVWKSIVQSIALGQKRFDEQSQERLLAIAADPAEIAALVEAVMAPQCAIDGSPMINAQAATVLAAFRHLATIISIKAPGQTDEVMRNLAAAVADLDPHVVMQILQNEDDPAGGLQVVQGLIASLDDAQVARLLAAALAADGKASAKLAQVFDTIVPDAERKRRVLGMARGMLSEAPFGQTSQFKAAWPSMEELLISYNDNPFISQGYRAQLDEAGVRAIAQSRDLPEEMPKWIDTLGQESVRKLSIILIIDLLKLERDLERATEIAADMIALGEDLLMCGDYAGARDVASALNEAANNPRFVARGACCEALSSLSHSAAMHETVAMLHELDAAQLALFGDTCRLCGPTAVDTLGMTLKIADTPQASRRGADIIVSFGASAIEHLSPFTEEARTFVLCNICDILGRIASRDGVPLLQPMLRKNDQKLTRAAIAALANISDPAAARAIHMVLRSATGDHRRAVIEALVAGRDVRVVPVLVRILQESDALGKDYPVVLDTLGALKVVHTDAAVRPIAEVMRQRRWFAPWKNRALKKNAIDTLASIGTEAAKQTLALAATAGDRVLRKIARAQIGRAAC